MCGFGLSRVYEQTVVISNLSLQFHSYIKKILVCLHFILFAFYK